MNLVLNLVWLVPLFPLLATAIVTFVPAAYQRKKVSARLTIWMMVLSLVLAVLVFVATLATPVDRTCLQPPAAGATVAAGGEGGEGGHEEICLPKPVLDYTFHWMQVGSVELTLGFWVDPLAAAMLVMVTLVGLCIFIYSQGYMAAEDYQGEDQRYSRFFSYLGLFAASMLGLVVADNILLLFICWELVGLCSYLLIGFWNFKKSAYDAAIKAFITTKIGDAGFFIAIFLLYVYTGQLSINAIIHNLPLVNMPGQPLALDLLKNTTMPGLGISVAVAVAIGLFIGTIGKSAQVPLHVWLPDAMEGPTPVSALIHAATMVAAGVFVVARMFPLFLAAGPGTLSFVAWTGGITAIFAATIAIAQNDIKRVLAYSTISQLGFMVLALGLGGYVAGFFHLITHAFFKALLFLGSGAVIIGAHHVQDMREMGGLSKRIPYTYWTYLIGMLALAGIPPLSGFFSKDEILLDAFKNNPALYVIATITAFLTAFYMTRQMYMIFAGEPRSHGAAAAAEVRLFESAPAHAYDGGEHEAHAAPEEPGARGEHAVHGGPVPLSVTVPLMVLAAGTVLLLVVGLPLNWFGLGAGTLFSGFVGGPAEFNFLVAGISILAACSGIGVGRLVYGGRRLLQTAQDPDPLHVLLSKVRLGRVRLGPRQLDLHLGGLFTLWQKKYYVDEFYGLVFVQGTHLVCRASAWFDRTIIDGFINGAAQATQRFSAISAWIDLNIVDGLVNVVGWFGRVFSAIQGWIDLYIVDGIVNGVAQVTGWVGERLRRVQTGRVQDYLLIVLLGILVVVFLFVYL